MVCLLEPLTTLSPSSRRWPKRRGPARTVLWWPLSRSPISKSAAMREKLPWKLLSIPLGGWRLSGNRWRQTRALRSCVGGSSWTAKTRRPAMRSARSSVRCITRTREISRWSPVRSNTVSGWFPVIPSTRKFLTVCMRIGLLWSGSSGPVVFCVWWQRSFMNCGWAAMPDCWSCPVPSRWMCQRCAMNWHGICPKGGMRSLTGRWMAGTPSPIRRTRRTSDTAASWPRGAWPVLLCWGQRLLPATKTCGA